ncbi:MAG: hypothetical protein WC110_08420, partial [Bacteroidales bacterium]
INCLRQFGLFFSWQGPQPGITERSEVIPMSELARDGLFFLLYELPAAVWLVFSLGPPLRGSPNEVR